MKKVIKNPITKLDPSLHGKKVQGIIDGEAIKNGEIFFDGTEYYVLSSNNGWPLKERKPEIAYLVEKNLTRGWTIGYKDYPASFVAGVHISLVESSSYIPFL